MNVQQHFAAQAQFYWVQKQGRGGAFPDRVPTKDQALWLLNGFAAPWRDGPATFGPELNANQPLGRLIAIAFEATDEEKADDAAWQAGPVARFRARYGFQ